MCAFERHISRVAFDDASSYVPGWDCHGLPIENKALKESAVC
jgi:isoleucyl-tRNA synthetase